MNNKELYERFKLINAIFNFEKEEVEVKMSKRSISKMVATFLLTIVITGGIVYATGVAIEKIWKKPEEHKINDEVSQEEKEKCISEEEAKNIGNAYLKKIGFMNEEIKNLQLDKEILEQENVWRASSDKVTIRIDAESGEIKLVSIPTWKNIIPENYGIDRVEARKVAKELLEKYKLENGEYELVKLTRNMETDEASYIWYAEFYKKYGDLLNQNESISIGWIPTINELYSLSLKNNKYENNEEKISKEEAIKIATEKDLKIETVKKIREVKAEIQIKQMNENAYLRENFKEEFEKGTVNMLMEEISEGNYKLKDDAKIYKTEERVRKVWVVVISYDVLDNEPIQEFSYFVDCTTGEIIGGYVGDSTQFIEKIITDTNNLIEK